MRRWDEGEQHGGSERVSERRNSRKRFGPLSGRFVLPRAVARLRVERSKAKDSNGDSWRISPLPDDDRNLSIWTRGGGVTKYASTRLLRNTLFVSGKKNGRRCWEYDFSILLSMYFMNRKSRSVDVEEMTNGNSRRHVEAVEIASELTSWLMILLVGI